MAGAAAGASPKYRYSGASGDPPSLRRLRRWKASAGSGSAAPSTEEADEAFEASSTHCADSSKRVVDTRRVPTGVDVRGPEEREENDDDDDDDEEEKVPKVSGASTERKRCMASRSTTTGCGFGRVARESLTPCNGILSRGSSSMSIVRRWLMVHFVPCVGALDRPRLEPRDSKYAAPAVARSRRCARDTHGPKRRREERKR